ncbi:MAG TPA: SHOCT domain-containing protein, partial [Tepidisphaeraceae bacterium]|nr:SHOCT domain-containing protein [Tepidisphaeraceae bacterium]
LRMPATFMQSEALLMVLKNLMRQNLERERKGEVSATPGKAPEAKPQPKPQPAPKPARRDRDPEDEAVRPAVKMPSAAPKPQKPAKQRQSTGDGQEKGPMVPELEKLVSLRDQGILTEEEFQAAKKRLLAAAR